MTKKVDRGKPDSPGDLTKPSWTYVARKTMREFTKDECTDLAAALTYYAVLALFPAIIAVLSLVGLFGQGPKTVSTVMNILRDIGVNPSAVSPRHDHPAQHRLRQRDRADHRAGDCTVVGVRLRRVVRACDEPHLRGR